jgi:hypothetical protein
MRNNKMNQADNNQQYLVVETVKQEYSNNCRMNHQKIEYASKYTISRYLPKKEAQVGKLHEGQGGLSRSSTL